MRSKENIPKRKVDKRWPTRVWLCSRAFEKLVARGAAHTLSRMNLLSSEAALALKMFVVERVWPLTKKWKRSTCGQFWMSRSECSMTRSWWYLSGFGKLLVIVFRSYWRVLVQKLRRNSKSSDRDLANQRIKLSGGFGLKMNISAIIGKYVSPRYCEIHAFGMM